MSAIVANTGSNNWNTNGAWVGGVQPTAADDVTIPATAVVTIPTATTAVARSVTVSASGTLAFASTTAVLTIGDGTAGTGNVALNVSSSATITLTGVGTINLVSTSATQQTINTGGKTIPNLTINGAGSSYLMADGLTSSGTITVSAGTFNTGSYAITCSILSTSGSTARTLTLGSSTITVSSSSTPIVATGSNLTITSNTAGFITNGVNPRVNVTVNMNGSSLTYTGGGAATIASGGTWNNVTVTGTASKTDGLGLEGTLTVTGTFTATGNSAVNRVIIQSNTLGTSRTLTAAAVSLVNVDFMDITGAGAAAPFTGTTLGDRLGNSGITFTTAATQTRDATSGQAWGVAARWTSRVPLPQDDVILNGSSGSISATDVAVLGKNIDASAYTGTITSTSTNTPYIAFGSVSFGGTFVQANTWYLEYRGRGSHTITSNGKAAWCGSSNGKHYLYAPGGTYTLADAFNIMQGTTGGWFYIYNGTFNTANYSMTLGQFSAGAGTATRAVTLGTTVMTHYSTSSATMMDYASTGLTWSGSSATHNITGTTVGNNQKTWTGGGGSFGTVNFNEAGGMGVLRITGANTFAGMNVGINRKLHLTAATTTTFTNAPTFTGSNQGYVRQLPGNLYAASVPDSAALSITGDIDIRLRLSLDDVAKAGAFRVFAKYGSPSANKSYRLYLSTGVPYFGYSIDGTTDAPTQQATASISSAGATNGVPFWLRMTREQSTGTVKYYYAADSTTMPSSWSQIGSNVAGTAGISFYDSTALSTVGGEQGGTNGAPGNYYWAQVRNNILDNGTGIQLDMKLQDKAFGVDTFTESSSNAATVTIYDAGTAGSIGDGRVQLESATAATHTLSSANPVDGTGMKITNSIASGSTPFYAGAVSLDVSGNTNWTFTARPSTGNHNALLLLGVG